MKTILCYGDSNTWGFTPGSGQRFAADVRWPGVMRAALGPDFHVVEEGLNARTTVLDDPTRVGRNGLPYLRPCLDSHAPLELVILMLGVNDLKHRFGLGPFDIAQNVAMLLTVIQQGVAPPVLLVAPPHVGPLPAGYFAEMFAGAEEKSRQLARHYRDVAEQNRCHFLDASEVATASPLDGIHLDAESHRRLGERMAQAVRDSVDSR
jgi:lysophospholipase L1-like esterase